MNPINPINPINPTNATLYLLRHGATEGKPEKRYIGQTDIPLSDLGREQARWWQNKLAPIQFDAIYCSDLRRALETAQLVSKDQTAQIQITPQLREINLGAWEGTRMQTIRDKYPDAWQKRGQALDRFRPPDGENFQDLLNRILAVIEAIDFNSVQNVLMLTHAGVNRVLLCHILNKPLQDLFHIPQGEAALNQIEYREGQFEVVSMNQLPP